MKSKRFQLKKGVAVYRPNQRHDMGFFTTWLVMSGNIINSRELIWQLFKRDFLGSYKKSFIGITWIFLSPVVGIISWVFLHQTGMLQPGEVGVPYPVYVLIGTSVWGLFIGFYNSAQQTLSAGSALILQVNYPHEALLFKQTAQQLANFSIAFLMNIVVLIIFGVVPSWKIVFFPLLILPLFLFGASIGLIVSMISIVAVDLNRVINMAMNLMMWLTPVIYSDKVNNTVVQTIVKWNPLTYLVCSARDIILYGELYHPAGFLICTNLAVLLFLISWRLFFVSEDKIVEKMV